MTTLSPLIQAGIAIALAFAIGPTVYSCFRLAESPLTRHLAHVLRGRSDDMCWRCARRIALREERRQLRIARTRAQR